MLCRERSGMSKKRKLVMFNVVCGSRLLCGSGLLFSLVAFGQDSASSGKPTPEIAHASRISSTATPSPLPRLVKFAGTLTDVNGAAHTGTAGVTFAIYSQPTGGAALWMETQNVTLDANGKYGVLLGAGSPDGLPIDLFNSGEARWLGVQPQYPGEGELPRVLLVSVPYAMKAGDAQTLGGLPASAYALAGAAGPNTKLQLGRPEITAQINNGAAPSGTANYLAKFDSASTI